MTRIEHDFIGDLEVPANAYYGVQSLRGKENFFITEEKNNQEIYFIIAFAYVKKAAAMANKELGVVKPEVAGMRPAHQQHRKISRPVHH